MPIPYRSALIVGAGEGLSASLARLFAAEGMRVALAARNVDKLAGLASETGASAHACDAADPAQVERLFAELDVGPGAPEVAVYNASFRTRGPLVELDPDAVAKALSVGAYGGFLMAREAARRMLPLGKGALLFTGASASVKGYARSAPFAMAKFALRGLAQSLARELHPQGIHVAHVIVDGAIANPNNPSPPDRPDSHLSPDAIAQTYLHLLRQDRSVWSTEIDVRPFVETF